MRIQYNHHCSHCGKENPMVEDSYTLCCNERACDCPTDNPDCNFRVAQQ